MPIAQFDPYPAGHWPAVLNILRESCSAAGYEANIVSEASEVGVIHRRIVQNLYDSEIVVCDVSGRNPNVMFELGIRLTFDKPTIIIKDELTQSPFDTGIIEYIQYPSDLNYYGVINFKEKLAGKITATVQKSRDDPNYSVFLKHFGEFKASKITTEEIPGYDLLLKELNSLSVKVDKINSRPNISAQPMRLGKVSASGIGWRIDLRNLDESERALVKEAIKSTGFGFVDADGFGGDGTVLGVPGIQPGNKMVMDAIASTGLGSRMITTLSGSEFLPF